MTKTSTTVYTYSYAVPTGDGTGTVTVGTAQDAAGNVVTSTPTSGATFTVDNTAPTGAITYSADGPYKQGATATVTATFTEALTTTPKIAISGVSTVAATNMTSTGSANVWTYAVSYTHLRAHET